MEQKRKSGNRLTNIWSTDLGQRHQGNSMGNGERKVSSTNAVGKIEYHMEKMSINSYLTLHTKINYTSITILTVKPKTKNF